MSIRHTLLLVPLALVACRSQSTKNDQTYRSNERMGQTTDHRMDPSMRSGSTDATWREASANRAVAASDRDFVAQATQGGLFEVQSSELALQKGVTGRTRDFAERMVADHGKANRELDDLCKRKGLATTMSLDAKHAGKLDELRQIDGQEFENRYRTVQIQAHDDAIRLFENAARDCQDPDLRSFAQRTLPTLREHRRHLDQLGESSSG